MSVNAQARAAWEFDALEALRRLETIERGERLLLCSRLVARLIVLRTKSALWMLQATCSARAFAMIDRLTLAIVFL